MKLFPTYCFFIKNSKALFSASILILRLLTKKSTFTFIKKFQQNLRKLNFCRPQFYDHAINQKAMARRNEAK